MAEGGGTTQKHHRKQTRRYASHLRVKDSMGDKLSLRTKIRNSRVLEIELKHISDGCNLNTLANRPIVTIKVELADIAIEVVETCPPSTEPVS